MADATDKEISTRDLIQIIKSWTHYLFSKWMLIIPVVLIFSVLGVFYAWSQKPVYTAELTFAAENTNTSSFGSYSGLAAQFGVDLSAGGGSVFEGDNLIELLKSRLLIEKTLLTPVHIGSKQELLVNYYIKAYELDKGWKKDSNLNKVNFSGENQPAFRARDSIMKNFCKQIIGKSLVISRVEKNLSLISVKMSDGDEVFAKLFLEQLTNNAIQFYIDYKIKKSKENVEILEHQTDSIKNLLSGNIVSVAVSNDLNINPLRQILRANTQRKQVDVQVNSQVYGELLKQLEFAKITLRKETPLIQYVDMPQLPLDKNKMGKLKGLMLFGLVGFFLIATILMVRRMIINS